MRELETSKLHLIDHDRLSLIGSPATGFTFPYASAEAVSGLPAHPLDDYIGFASMRLWRTLEPSMKNIIEEFPQQFGDGEKCSTFCAGLTLANHVVFKFLIVSDICRDRCCSAAAGAFSRIQHARETRVLSLVLASQGFSMG